MALETPILFCIFNRPQVTSQVFEAIAAQKPKILLVVQDGPRSDHPEDQQKTKQARAIINRVDWDCDVRTNISATNLGCKQRMATGITWAFAQFERLIILEDDCLPSASFFPYCETLLERFADDERIMTISGDNFQSTKRGPYSYYFSKWTHIWGWASWRRAWNHFDVDVASWPDIRKSQILKKLSCESAEQKHWQQLFNQQYAGAINTWDFPWMYANWVNNGLTVLPNVNLVSNLGFGPDATHTQDPASKLANMACHQLDQLSHPPHVIRDTEADRMSWHRLFKPANQSTVTGTPKQKPKWLRRFLPKSAA